MQISDRRGRRPPTTVGIRKRESLPFRMVSKYLQHVVWFCHKACVWRTDGQTGGQNYDSQDRTSIASSRCKNSKSSYTICRIIDDSEPSDIRF